MSTELEFVPANELKREYAVFAHFYALVVKGRCFNCRSVADIFLKSKYGIAESKPDAVFVMMNPGSSRPENSEHEWQVFQPQYLASLVETREYVAAKPDPTQYQLMRLMRVKKWKHARIINLSDLVEGNSGLFAESLKTITRGGPSDPTSILHESRRKELDLMCGSLVQSRLIAAWGEMPVLESSAASFLNLYPNLSGIPRKKSPWYAHAKPSLKKDRLTWLAEMGRNPYI